MKPMALVLLSVVACGPRGLAPKEGYVQVTGGRVWYRIVGGGTATPLLVIHGGPGVPSTYLKPLAALASERPVIFYDQLGSGKSDHPADTTLWRMDRYLAEVAQVRAALGLHDVHLYGHSWGTMLAVEYALTRPEGLRSLILGGPVLDARRFRHDDDSLIATLPDSVRLALRGEPPDAPTHSTRYREARRAYLEQFYARRRPWSSDLDSAVAGVDQTSATAMKGFMRTYDRTDRLHEIALPALFLAGAYDNTTPATTRAYQRAWPGAELVVFDSSGHLPMQDEPRRYVQVIHDFLSHVEHP
jgi:proline iminopeptidase